jgi:hypothetical protein
MSGQNTVPTKVHLLLTASYVPLWKYYYQPILALAFVYHLGNYFRFLFGANDLIQPSISAQPSIWTYSRDIKVFSQSLMHISMSFWRAPVDIYMLNNFLKHLEYLMPAIMASSYLIQVILAEIMGKTLKEGHNWTSSLFQMQLSYHRNVGRVTFSAAILAMCAKPLMNFINGTCNTMHLIHLWTFFILVAISAISATQAKNKPAGHFFWVTVTFMSMVFSDIFASISPQTPVIIGDTICPTPFDLIRIIITSGLLGFFVVFPTYLTYQYYIPRQPRTSPVN